LARDWGKACQACGLLSAQTAQLGHFDQHCKCGDFRNAGNADENGGLFTERFVRSDDRLNGCIYLRDIALNLA
jgi:hypothetical protein